MDKDQFAEELLASICHTITAHSKYPKAPDDAIRYWDNTTPYAIHPIWCAITLLTETGLPEKIRYDGYLALLWHDILEDTNMSLPENTRKDVQNLVQDMTFKNFNDELERIESCSETIKLLKLYDKVSILLDAIWMSDSKWNQLVEYTLELCDFVFRKYGELNIVKIAYAVCKMRNEIDESA